MSSRIQDSDKTDQHTPFDPAAHGWEAMADDGFIGLVGPIWQRPDAGGTRYGFLADSKHRNRRDIVHGGMIMSFADRALGMTARHGSQRPQVTIQLDVHFVDAVHIGEFVEAQVEIVRQTRSLVFVQGELLVGTRVVATANGIWRILADR